MDVGRNRTAGGFGLGLAIVKAIAEAHRGSVGVRSSVRPGCHVRAPVAGHGRPACGRPARAAVVVRADGGPASQAVLRDLRANKSAGGLGEASAEASRYRFRSRDEPVQFCAVHDPAWKRIGGGEPNQPGDRKLPTRTRDDQVAEPAAPEHARIGEHAHVREHRTDGRHPGLGVRERRPVADVDREQAAGRQRSRGRSRELNRGQVGGGAAANKNVGHREVKGSRAELLEYGPGVGHADPDPGGRAALASRLSERQPFSDGGDQLLVVVHGQLRRSRPRRRNIPSQRQPPAAQVQHPDRLAGGSREVDQVAEPADILELQVAGVVQVNVGLRKAAGHQRPGSRPVRVGP